MLLMNQEKNAYICFKYEFVCVYQKSNVCTFIKEEMLRT